MRILSLFSGIGAHGNGFFKKVFALRVAFVGKFYGRHFKHFRSEERRVGKECRL